MSKMEDLEGRQLLAASPTLLHVRSATADNRGEVVLQLSDHAKGVADSTVSIYTAGKDHRLYTKDDVKVADADISYNDKKRIITIDTGLSKDTAYRIRLNSSKGKIRDAASGALLDGEFAGGNLTSGNGRAGGDYQFSATTDASTTPTVRMTTNLGIITIKLRADVAPRTVANFLSYANTGRYDQIIFTRGISGFIDQLGGLQVSGDGKQASDIIGPTKDPALTDEARVLSNTRGTLSYAKSGADSAQNNFFFNLGDNSSTGSNNLDEPTQFNATFFTPFAQVTDSTSFAVLDKVASTSTANLTSQVNSGTSGAGVDAVPVKNASASTKLVPINDLYIVNRTAELMTLSAVS